MNFDSYADSILSSARDIKLLALDVDGVLSDGSVYYTANGDEIKAFNILDGQGIKSLSKHGIIVAIITGRNSPLTQRRAQDLGIKHIIQGREDKITALNEILSDLKLNLGDTAYIGDDLPDVAAIKAVKLGITVPNGHFFVKQHADHCTQAGGGKGAVREVCDLILHAKGLLNSHLNNFL